MFETKDLINRTVKSIQLLPCKTRLVLSFTDGEPVHFQVEGDCCSWSWVEHLESPNDLDGATLVSVDQFGLGEIDSTEHECLKVYQTRFRTSRGDIVVEYRNSSNGYYGGWMYRYDPTWNEKTRRIPK